MTKREWGRGSQRRRHRCTKKKRGAEIPFDQDTTTPREKEESNRGQKKEKQPIEKEGGGVDTRKKKTQS